MNPVDEESLHELLLKREQQLMDPSFRKNRDAVSNLLAADFCEFGSSGSVWSREAILDQLETEAGYTSPTVCDFATKPISAETVLATYRTVSSAAPVVCLRSSLWVFRDGRWQVLFHQGTRTFCE